MRASVLMLYVVLGLLVLSQTLHGQDAIAAPCDPSPPAASGGGNYHVGVKAFTDASYMGGVYGQLENYNPIVAGGDPAYGGTVAWVMIGNSPYSWAQIGWMKKKDGSRATFVQGHTSAGSFLNLRNLPVDSVGTYTDYGVEYSPAGNPFFRFKKSGTSIVNWNYNNFVPNNAQASGEITDHGDQYPGDGGNWMGFYDIHKWHWGYWTEISPTLVVHDTHSDLDGVYYGTTFWTRDTICN